MTTVWLVFLVLSSAGILGATVWLVVLAFKESQTWGLISVLVPFGVLAFAVKFWDESKKAMIVWICCGFVAVLTGLGFSMATVNSDLDFDTGSNDLWADSMDFQVSPIDSMEPSPVVESDVGEQGSTGSGSVEGKPDSINLSSGGSSTQTEIPENQPRPTPRSHRRGRRTIAVTEIDKFLGERATLILKSGERVFCIIEEIEPAKIRVRRIVGGGAVLFTVTKADIREIEVRSWQ